MTRINTVTAALLCMSATSAGAADFTITPTSFNGAFRWSVQAESAAAQINPTMHLMRGETYTLDVSTSSSHPFWLTMDGTFPPSSANAYSGTGVSPTLPVSSHTSVTFNVPQNAPDILFYNCGNHSTMVGEIDVSIFRDGLGD